jgi:hypothetical protein
MTEHDGQPQGTWTITVKGDQGWIERLRAEFGGAVIEGEQAMLAQAMRHATWTPPPDQRIERALEFASRYASTDGDHHKLWVIDQMARALTGCPLETVTATNWKGDEYSYEAQGENEAYSRVASEWGWEEGIAP